MKAHESSPHTPHSPFQADLASTKVAILPNLLTGVFQHVPTYLGRVHLMQHAEHSNATPLHLCPFPSTRPHYPERRWIGPAHIAEGYHLTLLQDLGRCYHYDYEGW